MWMVLEVHIWTFAIITVFLMNLVLTSRVAITLAVLMKTKIMGLEILSPSRGTITFLIATASQGRILKVGILCGMKLVVGL